MTAVEYRAEPNWVGMATYETGTLVASAIPVKPPKSWFDNPGLTRLSPLTVTADGQVYGHVAAWESSHIGRLGRVRPPRSRSNYKWFRTGEVETAEGEMVAVGQITLTGGHAPLEASAQEAVAHYDNTQSAVMDVAIGEDPHGIWVAGALRPDVDDIKIRAIRASSFSGDWRPIENSLEMVAICAVNVPGFPIPRALAASGEEWSSAAPEILALVAAGTETLVTIARRDPLVAAAESVIEDLDTKMEWLRAALSTLTSDAHVEVEEESEVAEPDPAEIPEESEVEAEAEAEVEAEEAEAETAEPEEISQDEDPAPTDDVDAPDNGDNDEEPAAEDSSEEFRFTDDLSTSVLADEITAAGEAEILWDDNLPIQFSTAQAEAVALRLKFRGASIAVDPTLRAEAAAEGVALADGRLPLRSADDLLMAVQIIPKESVYYSHVETRAEALGVDLDDLREDALVAAAVKQKYDFGTRLKMVKTGAAMKGGAYPIADVEDLKNAIQAIGRAKDPAATKAHIMKRARALNAVDQLPEKWSE